jgi:pimeloyl-ACP methyl ester carboxylesterase
MNPYQGPMKPFPGFATYSRIVHLPNINLDIFLYDAEKEGAPVILFIHGLGDEADTWRHVILPLADQFRVIALDLPGFGRSEKPNRSYNPLFFQQIILELMDVLEIKRVILVGHSLGAIIAHAIGLEHPDRLNRLVLVDGSMVVQRQKVDLNTMLFMIPGLGEWLYGRFRKDPQAAYESLRPYYAHLEELPSAEREFLYQRVNERVWSEGQERAFFSTFRNLVRWIPREQRDLPSRLAKLYVPTLVLWGEEDCINPVENGQFLPTIQPSAELLIVSGAGHNVQQEKPQIVLDGIQRFIRKGLDDSLSIKPLTK